MCWFSISWTVYIFQFIRCKQWSKDNNNVVAAAPTTNSKIVGTWELTNKGSYAIVRNPRTHKEYKEYKVGFTIWQVWWL